MTATLLEAAGFAGLVPSETYTWTPVVQECCENCHRPMADGGSPLPGEGKTVRRNGQVLTISRACASCWKLLLELANAPEDDAEVRCHHGVSLDEPCLEREIEINGDDEEIID